MRCAPATDGLTYLVYGTREPGDSVYYPETGQVRLRGLGVTLTCRDGRRRSER